ncbi:MAG TPA: FAD binding domain-containing protein [Bradyrhizobium sp.]|nr:FAD binding domain-containing protein [Bradyrhizobium sp.]
MKPAPFTYTRADSAARAIELIKASDGFAKYISGGQTLGPMINLRLTQPDALIDVSDIAELRQVQESPREVRLGAAIRHAEIEDGKAADPSQGLMLRAARTLAYRAIRNRGTIGGSLAHADPVAEWPTIFTALNAMVHVASASGNKTIPIGDFLLGYLTPALDEHDLITAISVPRLPSGCRTGFQKFCRKSGEFAHSLAAVVLAGKQVARVALGCAIGKPILLPTVASIAAGAGQWRDGLANEVARAAVHDLKAAGAELDDYDEHLHATIVSRAVEEALR